MTRNGNTPPISLLKCKMHQPARCSSPRVSKGSAVAGFKILLLVLLALCGALPVAGQEAAKTEIRYDPETGQPLVTVIMDQPIERVLAKITEQTGVNIVAEGRAVGVKVSLVVKDKPLMQVLEQVAASNALMVYSAEGDPTIKLMDQQHFEQNYLPKQVEKRVFFLENVPPEEFVRMLQSGVLTPNIGTAAVNVRDSSVVVTDLPAVLAAIDEILAWIEVKPVLRVFQIYKGNLEFIVDTIKTESQRFRGVESDIVVDVPNRRIIVVDTLEHIKKLESWVELLDIRPELRSYQLHNVGLDAAGIDSVEQAISDVLSPDAYIKFDEQNHVMLVRDVPEVHEDIEQIISQIDVAPPQVLVQAEIIETQSNFSLNYGANVQLSGDLFNAAIDGLLDVPTGVAEVTAETLGFADYRKEFPAVSLGSSGIVLDNLSRHARITFNAAMSDAKTQILAQPRLYLKNRDRARLNVGGQVPFLTSTFNDSNISNTRSFTQQTQEEGITLEVEVAISGGDMVEMNINLRNNDAFVTPRTFDGQNFELVGLRTEELETVLIIPNGNTRVVGGLINRSRSDSKSGIPYLHKIPIIGPLLFGSRARNAGENFDRNLMVFLTPYIIQPGKSPLVAAPENTYEPRGYALSKKMPELLDDPELQEFIDQQLHPHPALEQIEIQTGDQPATPTATLPEEGAAEDEVEEQQVQLNTYRFRLTWTSVEPLRDGFAAQLSPAGEILKTDTAAQTFLIREQPDWIEQLETYLTGLNRRAAEAAGALDPPETLAVKAERISSDAVKTTEGDKWDPLRGYSTYQPRPGTPTGIVGQNTAHKGAITSTRSSAGGDRRTTTRVRTSAGSRSRSPRDSQPPGSDEYRGAAPPGGPGSPGTTPDFGSETRF